MSSTSRIHPSQIIKCINIARQYPKYYLPLLEQQICSFENDFEYRINKQTICETNEGKEAWLVAKKFLESQTPIAPLVELPGLDKAANCHASDLETIDQITHSGSDGSSFVDRILRFCEKSQGALVEIIGNDFDMPERNHAEMIVLGLIIDDGVTSRGHRNSIFNQDYKYIGCAVGYLSGKIVGVINMSQAKLKEKPSKGNAFTSTTNLAQSKVSNKSKQAQEQFQLSRASQVSSQRASSSLLSQKSHKSQKVWTFTKVQEQSKKIVCQSRVSDGKNYDRSQRPNNDSKISINNQKKQPQSQYKQNGGQQKSQGSRKSLKSGKSQQVSQSRQQQNTQFLGKDLSNNPQMTQSKSSWNSTGMKSQSSSGFKKIKQKKEASRVWQEGEFKYEQKTTSIKYTDGTEQQFKEKTSLLLENYSKLDPGY